MSGIRVTYSGLISFVIGLVSVITGLVFILIVTRQLTQEEFGTWGLIGNLIVYVIFVEPIISYWAIRETARGGYSAKTAVLSSGIFSIGGIFVYMLIAFVVGQSSEADLNLLYFASILIPVLFLNKTLTAITRGWKPQIASYGLLIFELTKIPVGLLLVYFLQMGLEGAILATAVAYVASDLLLLIYAREKIRGKINLKFIKKWFRLSWLPMYPGISGVIYTLDVIIFSAITGSVMGIAFYAAASAVTSLIGHSYLVSRPLYPKLLEGGKHEYVQESLIQFLYFSIPLTAMSIAFAKPALFALNPIYGVGFMVVVFMAIRVFFHLLNSLFSSALSGIERVDVDENSTFKQYIRSKLFFLPTIRLIHNIIYITIVTIVLLMLKTSSLSQVDLVVYWAAIGVATNIPLTVYMYYLARKHFTIKVNSNSLVKYLLVSIGIFGLVYFLIEKFLVYNESIYEFLPDLLLFAALGAGGYLAVTYFIDQRTKKLFHGIIDEIRSKSKN